MGGWPSVAQREREKGFFWLIFIYYFADMAGQKLSGVKWQGINVSSWVENLG